MNGEPTDQQHENARATARDVEWLENQADEAARHAAQLETDEEMRDNVLADGSDPDRRARAWRIQEGFYRRILNSLRSPSVPDREQLARALYMVEGGERSEEARARFWNSGLVASGLVRDHWMGEADRLVRILGGFHAVPQPKPIRWLVIRDDGSDAPVRRTEPDALELQAYAQRGWKATPLYAAPVFQHEPRAWACPQCGNLLGWYSECCQGPEYGGTASIHNPPVPRENGVALYALEDGNDRQGGE